MRIRPTAVMTGLLAGVIAMAAASTAPAQVSPTPAPIFPLVGYEGQPAVWDDLDTDGRPASMTSAFTASDMAVTADGTVILLHSQGLVRRIGLDGIVTDVAGLNPARTRPADTPALRENLGPGAGAVAATPDGSVLVSTQTGIVRVAPDQSIARLWPSWASDMSDMSPLPSGDVLGVDGNHGLFRLSLNGDLTIVALVDPSATTPATSLSIPSGVAALPDGGALVSDLDSVHRVDPSGQVSAVTSFVNIYGPPTDVELAPDGGFYAAVQTITRFSVDGTPRRAFATQARDFARRRHGSVIEITVLPDGNIAFISDNRVWLLVTDPANAAQRAAVALRNLSVTRDRVLVTFETTTTGSVTLSVAGKNGQPLTHTQDVPAGVSTIEAQGPFSNRGEYVKVQLRDPAGRIAQDQIRAWLAPRLLISEARRILDQLVGPRYGFVGDCRRFTGQRVDCMIRRYIIESSGSRPKRSKSRCDRYESVSIPRTGVPRLRHYRCKLGFRRKLPG